MFVVWPFLLRYNMAMLLTKFNYFKHECLRVGLRTKGFIRMNHGLTSIVSISSALLCLRIRLKFQYFIFCRHLVVDKVCNFRACTRGFDPKFYVEVFISRKGRRRATYRYAHFCSKIFQTQFTRFSVHHAVL